MRYEVLMLAVPEITSDEASQLEMQLREVIREHKGACISFEKWGKYRLAYPVKRNEYGVYFLLRFEALVPESLQSLLKAVRAVLTLKYNEIIMRHLVNKLDEKESLVYQRPESLEEIPGKVTDALMREHKLDGAEGRSRSRDESRTYGEQGERDMGSLQEDTYNG